MRYRELTRPLVAATTSGALTWLLAGWTAEAWRRAQFDQRWLESPLQNQLDTSLELVGAAGATALAGWWFLLGALALATRLPGSLGTGAAWVLALATPRAARAAVVLAVGSGAMGSGAACSPAEPPSDPLGVTIDRPRVSALSTDQGHGFPRPSATPEATTDLERTRPATGADPAPQVSTRDRLWVTVRPGDSLWAIAERHLDPGASTSEVAAAWPRWYEANRQAIGSDPHLITPGLRLREPAVPPVNSTTRGEQAGVAVAAPGTNR
jgi:hypothetical protein